MNIIDLEAHFYTHEYIDYLCSRVIRTCFRCEGV